MKDISCSNCVFFEIIAKSGDSYVYMDPHGNESTRQREEAVSICRAVPPYNGWPLVYENDWCGNFNSGEIIVD